MGAWAIRVTKPEEIGPAMAEAFAVRRAAVVEIVVDSKILSEPYRRDALRHPQRVLEKYTA